MPHADPRAWNVDDVAAFLTELRLERYVDTFRDEDVDGLTLLKYTKDDLLSVGLTGPHANKVLAKIEAAAAALPSARTAPSQSVGGGRSGGGERVGEYELLRVLGEGGFGTALLARHAGTGDEVAVKQVVVPNLSAASKATDEAMQLVRLEHPQLVKVHSVFFELHTLGRYTVNIVMEYCSRGDLAAHLQQSHPLGETEVVRLLAQVLCPLQASHHQPLLWRTAPAFPRVRHVTVPHYLPCGRSTSTTRASPTATSSRRTCCSPPTARSSSPISGWREGSTRRRRVEAQPGRWASCPPRP